MDFAFVGTIIIGMLYSWVFIYAEMDKLEKQRYVKFSIHKVLGIQSIVKIFFLVYMYRWGFFTNNPFLGLLKELNPENEFSFLFGTSYRYYPFLKRAIWIFFASCGISSEISLIVVSFVLDVAVLYLVYYISVEAKKGLKTRDLFKKNYILYLLIPGNVLLLLQLNIDFYITILILLASILLFQKRKYPAALLIAGILLTYIWYIGVICIVFFINIYFQGGKRGSGKFTFLLIAPLIFISMLLSIIFDPTVFFQSLYLEKPSTPFTTFNIWYFIPVEYSYKVLILMVIHIVMMILVFSKEHTPDIHNNIITVLVMQFIWYPLFNFAWLSLLIPFIIIYYQNEKRISIRMLNIYFLVSLIDLIMYVLIQQYPHLVELDIFVFARISNLVLFQCFNVYFIINKHPKKNLIDQMVVKNVSVQG